VKQPTLITLSGLSELQKNQTTEDTEKTFKAKRKIERSIALGRAAADK